MGHPAASYALAHLQIAKGGSYTGDDVQGACCDPQYAPLLVHLARKITAYEMLSHRERYVDVLPGLEGLAATSSASNKAARSSGRASGSRPASAAPSAHAVSSGAASPLLSVSDASPRSGNVPNRGSNDGADHAAVTAALAQDQQRQQAEQQRPDMDAVVSALVLRNGVDAEHPMMQALCTALRTSIGVVYASGTATARVCAPRLTRSQLRVHSNASARMRLAAVPRR